MKRIRIGRSQGGMPKSAGDVALHRGRLGGRVAKYGPGVLIVAALAAVSGGLGRLVPVVGGPVFGIALGMAVQALRPPGDGFRSGIAFSAKYVLQGSVVILGLGLGLGQLLDTGVQTFPVMIGSLSLALVAAFVLGRLLGVGGELSTLIGAGTAICGGSAIAATSAVIGASEFAVAYSISTIFVYNALAVLIFPLLGHLMDMSQNAFGLWAGTAINDTSSVVAASYSYGNAAGDVGVTVKLARTTMIIPMTLLLAALQFRRRRQRTVDSGHSVPWKRIVPWFVVWFCAAAAINTGGFVPTWLLPPVGEVARFMITMALTAVGLSAKFGQMRRTGPRPLVLGGLLWVVVAASSLALQRIFNLA